MSLRAKVLLRSILGTMLIIGAMSLIYYWVLTRDIRERSQETLATASHVVFDDLQRRISAVQTNLDAFTRRGLAGPLYSMTMFQESSSSPQTVSIWDVKKRLSYASAIVLRLSEFAKLTGAAEIHVFNRERSLVALYQQGTDEPLSGIFLPDVSSGQLIPLAPRDRWHARLLSVDDIPRQPFPPELPAEYTGNIPNAPRMDFRALRQQVTTAFTVPVLDRGQLQGVCVIYLAFRPQDVERYARLSGTQVNLFLGNTLSVGTLSEYATLAAAGPHNTVFSLTPETLSTSPGLLFSTIDAGKHAYYQGLLPLGNERTPIGALTLLYPRRLEEVQKSRLLMLIVVVTCGVITLAVFDAITQSNAIVRPVATLMGAIKKMEQGDLDARADVKTGDELQTLANSFNTMGQQLKLSMQQREEQERLKREMDLARQIQTAILPTELYHENLAIEAVMLPAEEVGGDYYDVLYDEEGHLWLGIGDVSGHGVTPGLIMMMAQTIKTTVVSNHNCSPKDVVVLVNKILFKNVQNRLGKDHFMTFTSLKYLGDGRFQHAGAHLDLIVHRQAGNTCELIDTDGAWLNFIPDISVATSNAEFTLDIGDTLVLYTDGLTEAHSPGCDILDIQRFTGIVRKHAEKAPADMRDAILEDTLAWSKFHRSDDMSLVLVRRMK